MRGSRTKRRKRFSVSHVHLHCSAEELGQMGGHKTLARRSGLHYWAMSFLKKGAVTFIRGGLDASFLGPRNVT